MPRLPLSLSLAATLFASTALTAQETEPSLAWASIKDLHQRMDTGQLRSEALARLFLDRIRRIDQDGPALKSVLQTNPDALQLATQLDRQPSKGALHGIPVLLKDNIDTGDRMLTTAGSLALADAPPAPHDAGLVARLRKSGAAVTPHLHQLAVGARPPKYPGQRWPAGRSRRKSCGAAWRFSGAKESSHTFGSRRAMPSTT